MEAVSRNQKIWEKSDVLALVVWLDFCRQREDCHFKETITDHLFRSQKKTFTLNQVRSKLGTIARSNAMSSFGQKIPIFNDMISQGSAVLFPQLQHAYGLSKEIVDQTLRERIANQVHAITKSSNGQSNAEQSRGPRISTKSNTIASWPPEADHGINQQGFHRAFRPIHPNEEETTGMNGRPRGNNEVATEGNDIVSLKLQWEKEVCDLLAKNLELQGKNKRLDDLLLLAESARKTRQEASRDDTESLINSHLRISHDYRQRNEDLRKHVQNFAEITNVPRSLPEGKLDGLLRSISSELESMLHGTNCFKLEAISAGYDLKQLVDSCRTIFDGTVSSESHLEVCVSEYGLSATVRTLSLAALRDWVFATDFPNYGTDGIAPSLLKSYRSIAHDIGGWKLLRNYEVAAYSQLLESGEFSEMLLPRKANQLANRLVQALDPVMRSKSVEANQQPYTQRDVEDLHFRLVEMFQAGLTLKADTVITDHRYLFIVHPLGIPFEVLAHDSHTSNHLGSNAVSSTAAGSWLHASFKVYGPGNPNMLDSCADAIIQTTNFLSNEEGLDMSECILETPIVARKSERPSVKPRPPPSLKKRPSPTDFETPSCDIQGLNSSQLTVNVPYNTTLSFSQASGEEVSAVVCVECGKRLANKGSCERHMEKKSCNRCKSCRETFGGEDYKSKLMSHLQNAHPDCTDAKGQLRRLLEGLSLVCDQCPKKFTSSKNLHIHQGKIHKQDYIGRPGRRVLQDPGRAEDTVEHNSESTSLQLPVDRQSPTCRRTFGTIKAVKSHHFRTHRESLVLDGQLTSSAVVESSSSIPLENHCAAGTLIHSRSATVEADSRPKGRDAGQSTSNIASDGQDLSPDAMVNDSLSSSSYDREREVREFRSRGHSEELQGDREGGNNAQSQDMDDSTAPNKIHERSITIQGGSLTFDSSQQRETIGESRPRCPECNQKFHLGWQLRAHIEEIHTTKAPSKFYCQACSKPFGSPYKLKRHMLSNSHHNIEHPSQVDLQSQSPSSKRKAAVDDDIGTIETKKKDEGLGKDRPRGASTGSKKVKRVDKEFRREPTPPSRHVERMIAAVAKANKNFIAITSSEPRQVAESTGRTAPEDTGSPETTLPERQTTTGTSGGGVSKMIRDSRRTGRTQSTTLFNNFSVEIPPSSQQSE
ncbi:hypothetical protein BKA65DRAFT_200840 [Rhexocercosporidium sp. MPI-PUGE-AT-0058]|nr:hypothetical protein BKA65DRAFT_200840 [Rhexocercosporidium sp. MPI-PUGE-AT-0058]